MRNSVVLGMLWLEKTLDSTWHLRCCIFHIFHKLSSLKIVTICQSGHMMYIFYGSLGVLLWKCGTQLLKVTIFPHKWQWFNYKEVFEKAEGWNSEIHSYQVALTQSPSMSKKPKTTWPIAIFFPKGGQVSQPGWRRGEKEETPAVQDVEIQKSCLLVC